MWLIVAVGRADGALQTLAEVRELPRGPASVGLPLTVRGVVLQQKSGEAADRQELVVHDGTAAIYVVDMPASPVVRTGDRVEVELVTEPGRYAMMARGLRLVRLGEGVLPEPLPVTLGALKAGVFDAQWVRLKGVVASAIPEYPTRMALNTDQGVVCLNVFSQVPPAACERLIEAEVVVDRSGTVAGLQYAVFRKTGVLPLPRPVELTRTP